MRLAKRRLRTKLLYAAALLGTTCCVLALYSRPQPTTPVSATARQIQPAQVESASSEARYPVRLTIPSIAVDAALDYVGLTATNDMAAPKGPTNAGWYYLGTRPGDIGSAVIDGHYGWKDDVPAVFDSLQNVKQGDKLYVQDDHDATTIFVVREIQTYSSNEDASKIFHSTDGKAHLNLITCHGDWDAKNKGFSSRLVVFADAVSY